MLFKTTPDTLNFKDSKVKRAFAAGFFSGVTIMLFIYFLMLVSS